MMAAVYEVDDIVDISGIDKAALLASLYNAARPNGPARNDNVRLMTPQDATCLLEAKGGSLFFHKIDDRILDVDLGRNNISARGYDEIHGTGRLAQIVHALRRARA